ILSRFSDESNDQPVFFFFKPIALNCHRRGRPATLVVFSLNGSPCGRTAAAVSQLVHSPAEQCRRGAMRCTTRQIYTLRAATSCRQVHGSATSPVEKHRRPGLGPARLERWSVARRRRYYIPVSQRHEIIIIIIIVIVVGV
ncbi:Uncharacterized protein DBV15_12284, partial [Temnothorax longispinosus]